MKNKITRKYVRRNTATLAPAGERYVEIYSAFQETQSLVAQITRDSNWVSNETLVETVGALIEAMDCFSRAMTFFGMSLGGIGSGLIDRVPAQNGARRPGRPPTVHAS